MMPVELLLSSISRVAIDGQTSRTMRDVLSKSIDWREVLRKAEKSGVTALLYHNLKEADLELLVPPDVLSVLKHTYITNGVRNMALLREAELLVQMLDRECLPAIVLKGTALLATAYPTIAMRRMCDIDLLFRPHHLPRAAAVLVANGFTHLEKGDLAEGYATDFVRQDRMGAVEIGASVELHAELVSEKAPFTIDLDALWARAIAIRIGRTDMMALSVEDQVHNLAAHLFTHHFAPAWQWRNMCDLSAILRTYGSGGIDWDYLLQSSREYRTAGAVFLMLNSLDESLKPPPLTLFLDRLKPVIDEMGIAESVSALGRHLPRYDMDALSLRPSTVTDMVEEPSLLGKVRIALSNLNSTRRLIAFHGLNETRREQPSLVRALRSLKLVTKYNLSSIRMAYLIGKLSKETRKEPVRDRTLRGYG
ncbi:MAG: nucleotidyltransferase family protein [Chloroflexi bacterium]|nr:nucleotidyltransferase family protein [Chloroflexota bacterium]